MTEELETFGWCALAFGLFGALLIALLEREFKARSKDMMPTCEK